MIALVRLYLLPGYEGMAPRWGHYVLLTGLTPDGFLFSDPLQTERSGGTGRYIAAGQLERAMQASLVPGQALAFGGQGRRALPIWTP